MGCTITNAIQPPVIQSSTGNTDISTALGTYADMDSMVLTANQSGKHIICFSAIIKVVDGSGDNLGGYFQIIKNGNQISQALLQGNFDGATASSISNTLNIIVISTLTAGDVLKVQWKRYAAGNQVINNVSSGDAHRILWIMRVSDY